MPPYVVPKFVDSSTQLVSGTWIKIWEKTLPIRGRSVPALIQTRSEFRNPVVLLKTGDIAMYVSTQITRQPQRRRGRLGDLVFYFVVWHSVPCWILGSDCFIEVVD
jgi:hypothetical protein